VLCERPFALNCQQPKTDKQNVGAASPGKISADAHGKGAWAHHNESVAITALLNTAERSFSKLKLIKTFHRSTMIDEKLTNMAMIFVESELQKHDI